MLTISRDDLRAFRLLVRRASLHKSRCRPEPCLAIVADANGCRLRAASADVAVEHRIAGSLVAASLLLPISALDAWNSRGADGISLESSGPHSVIASWSDRGVPRQTTLTVDPKAKVEFPEPPTNYVSNEVRLWAALRDAVATADSSPSRFALHCLHLRGGLGRIDAADGHHILTQSGFQWGFDDDLLVLADPVLGCRELEPRGSVRVGRSGDWIGLGVSDSLVMLRVQKEVRFPKIDDLLPSPELASSRLELSAGDATYLADVIERLPGDDRQHAPVTLDLNGKVLVRSRDPEQPRATEIELTSSRLDGDPVVFCSDRQYVGQAMRLGFREAFIFGPTSPVLCRDERRQFLWAVLDAEGVVPRSDDAICIQSSPPGPAPTSPQPAATKPHSTKSLSPKTASVKPAELPAIASPIASSPPAPVAIEPARSVRRVQQPRPAADSGPIDQAIALREALRNAASAAHQLVRSLKQRQRQSRIVATTLASLKQLQNVGG